MVSTPLQPMTICVWVGGGCVDVLSVATVILRIDWLNSTAADNHAQHLRL